MKFLIGTKQYMTQVFDAEGRVQPATVLAVAPMTVTDVKNKERDGYEAVQVGVGTRKEKNVSKAVRGHLKELGVFALLREFRAPVGRALEKMERGATLGLEQFAAGDMVQVRGVSKGKGFQGVVKRHGFAGGPKTHGQKHSLRAPGSIGATGPQRVLKGTRMGGRMGTDKVTVRGLRVLEVDTENGTLVVRGAVPGRRGTVVEVRGKN